MDIEQILLTVTSNDISIEKSEKIDLDMAMWLVSQNDIVSMKDKKTISTMLKNRFKGNQFQAIYKLGKLAEGTIGRFVVKSNIGLQGLQGDIRAALMKNFYWDVDFENCQPQILLQECKKSGWKCDNLEYYCNNRKKMFSIFQEQDEKYTRQFIKNEFIRLLFGGLPRYNTPEWIANEFYPEVSIIMNNISNAYPKFYAKALKSKDRNIHGSACSLFLQTQERRCLMALDNFLNQKNRYMGVLIHDGGCVERLHGETEFPIELLRQAEDFVYETTGLRLKLVVKPIETTFVIPDKRMLQLEKTYPHIKSEFEQKHFKCIRNGCYYEIDDDHIEVRDKKRFVASYEHLQYEELDKDSNVVDKQFIDRWMKDKDIRVYNKVALYPPPLVCPKDHFNLWTGYRIEKIDLSNITNEQEQDLNASLEFVLEHYKKIFGEECYEYVLDWNAMLVQKPGIKPLIGLLINSKPGLGKERIINMNKKMFGDKYILITQKADDIFGKFNSLIEGKLLICVDEIKMSVMNKYSEEFKSYITADELPIEAKGIKQYMTDSYLHMISYSNKDFPFKIEENDRRYVAIDRCIENPPEYDYNIKIIELTENDLVMRKLFDFFMNRDISKFRPKEDRPNTSFMTDLKEISRDIELQFMIHFITELKQDYECDTKDLFAHFIEYMKENFSEIKYPNSTNKLSLKIKKLGIDGFMKTHTRKGDMWKIEKEKALEWCYKNNYIEKTQPRLLA